MAWKVLVLLLYITCNSTHRVGFLRHLLGVFMWYVSHYSISKWLERWWILCYHWTDNDSPILDKVFRDIFIRQEFCKLDLIDRLLAAGLSSWGSWTRSRAANWCVQWMERLWCFWDWTLAWISWSMLSPTNLFYLENKEKTSSRNFQIQNIKEN